MKQDHGEGVRSILINQPAMVAASKTQTPTVLKRCWLAPLIEDRLTAPV